LFKSRFGHYPEAVYVDQIYRTRSNRAYCRNLGIRITAPPLGRPVPDDLADICKQTLEDAKVRNQIEGKFGQAKRRFSLNRVMTKLANTSETAIAITFLVMNLLEALLKQLAFLFFSWFMLGRQRRFKLEMQRILMKQRILRMGYDSQEIFSVCDL